MSTRSAPSDRLKAPFAAALLVLGFATLYAFTAQRGVSWGDSGLFQLRILSNDLQGDAGLALAHPLYVATAHLLARLMPASAQLWFLNALSGFWGALAVGAAFACAWRLTRSLRAAALAALSLGGAHMFWWLSTMSEVYTLSVLLLACETYCLLTAVQERRPWPAVAALLANGVHFSVHNFALLSLPVDLAALGWLAWREPAGRRGGVLLLAVAAGMAAWLAGALPILTLAADRHQEMGSLWETVQDVLVGRYGAAVAGRMEVPIRVTLFNYALAGMSFALPCLLPALRAFRHFRPSRTMRPETVLLAVLLLVHFLFWVRYRVADQATFLLPTLFLALMLAARPLATARRPRLLAVATLLASVFVPAAAVTLLDTHAGALLRQRGPLPFRDDLRYFALPWKHNETSAARFASAARRELPTGALLYVDSTTMPPLAVARRQGHLPATIRLSSEPPGPFPPSSRWEVRPFGDYRISPPEATVVRRGTFYEVTPTGRR